MTADPLAALAKIINLAGISGGNTYAVAAAVEAAGWRFEPDTLRDAADDYEIAVRGQAGPGAIAPMAEMTTAADVVVWLRARATNYLPPATITKHLEQTGGLRTCDTCHLTGGDCRCPHGDETAVLRTRLAALVAGARTCDCAQPHPRLMGGAMHCGLCGAPFKHAEGTDRG